MRRLIIILFFNFLFSTSAISKDDLYKCCLYVPTYIDKISGNYYIVDSAHHRVLYSKNIGDKIEDWNILDDDIAGPHSLASNGKNIIIDEGGRGCIRNYSIKMGVPQIVNSVCNLGDRPHRVVYSNKTDKFYAISANDRKLIILKINNNRINLEKIIDLGSLIRKYTRSLTIRNEKLYIVSYDELYIFDINNIENMNIRRILVNKKYITNPFYGLNDLFFLDGKSGYITATPSALYHFNDLMDLESGTLKKIPLIFNGTPYYISKIDGMIYIPEIGMPSQIRSYRLKSSELVNEKLLHTTESPSKSTLQRHLELPF